MSYILKVKNENGEWVHIPAIVGASAYQIAQENGFLGTEEEWLESFNYRLTAEDKQEIADNVRNEYFNDIKTALSELHTYAEAFDGGDG